jgi:hypothetical protein
MRMMLMTILAFGVGLGAVAGAQSFGLWSMTQYLRAPAASRAFPEMKPAYSFDQTKLGTPILPKMPPIDTSIGQRAAAGALNRQIDLNIRAGNSVPRPQTYPGMRRF